MNEDKKIFENSKEKINKKFIAKNWVCAFVVLLIVALTIITTWGLPQLLSHGSANYPSLPLDSKIPLITGFVWAYYLTFPLGAVTIFVLYFKNRENLWNIVFTLIIACIISSIFYFEYPTEMIKPYLDPVTFSDKFTIMTWNACRPVCCLPSQHCYMAISCIIASIYEKNTPWVFRIFTLISGISIILSTVFIKQHYVLDFVASFVIIVPLFLIFKLGNVGKKFDKIFEEQILHKNKDDEQKN